jgi:pyrroline-5-carboxylate reductase
MKISFIGGGNMGEAILARVLAQGLVSREEVTVSDVSEMRRDWLSREYRVRVTADNREAAEWGEVVVLAVKPQGLAGVMAGLKGAFKAPQLVLSIVAGVRLSILCSGLGYRRVVRVMPNTPAQIGEGMSVWTAAAEVTGEQRKRASAILGAMGREIYFEDEKYLDMATAVSGTGPAYLFLFAEALAEAAVEVGFSYDVARELVGQTILGSARFMTQSDKLPVELRRQVTSPGGTTEAALARLEAGRFTKLIKEAVSAAYHRAQELGG